MEKADSKKSELGVTASNDGQQTQTASLAEYTQLTAASYSSAKSSQSSQTKNELQRKNGLGRNGHRQKEINSTYSRKKK